MVTEIDAVLEGWLEVSKAAALVQKSKANILHHIHRGHVRARRIGGIWLVEKESLLVYFGARGELEKLPRYKNT